MPIKTHKVPATKHPKHYAKVYWPYIPLLLIVGAGLWLGHPTADQSQNGIHSQAADITSSSLLTQTNQQRQKYGESTLEANAALTAAATAKANDMTQNNYWSLKSPAGQLPWTLIRNAGYAYQKAGENLAYGFSDSRQTVTGWMNSQSHRANLLDTSYQQVGFGISRSQNFQGEGPQTIVVALYGAPVGSRVSNTDLTDGLAATAASSSSGLAALTDSTKTISKVQALTGGELPWISAMLAFLGLVSVAYLVIRHGYSIQRSIRRGEHYVLKHPVFDLTLVAFAALCALLCQSVGFIR